MSSPSFPDAQASSLGSQQVGRQPGSHAVDQAGQTREETRSLGEIVSDISNDMSTLMRKELELAKTELKEEATKTGLGIGMLAGAGICGLLVLTFLSWSLLWLLDNWIPVELSALIVALLWGAVAAGLALTGRKKIQEANPQLPETQQSLKEDVQWAKAQKN